MDLATHDTIKRHTVAWVTFPVEFMLLPQTDMSCNKDDEKDSLFSDATISKMSTHAAMVPQLSQVHLTMQSKRVLLGQYLIVISKHSLMS